MKNKLGKRVLTMALAMVLTFASCVTAFAQMGTAGDHFFELTEYYSVWKGTTNDAGQVKAYVEMTTTNDATNVNAHIKEALAKDYFVKGSTLETDSEYGAVSKDNLSTLVTNEASLRVNTYERALSAWVNINKVTNADADFDGTIVYESTEAVTNKLTAAGYTGKSLQFHTKGSGRLPGAANFTICDFETTYAEAGSYEKGDAYLYYYDATADSFVLVDNARFYSSYSKEGWKYLEFYSKNAKAVSKGAYVFTTDKIADATTIKNVVVAEGGSWYLPDGVDMTGIDMSFTVGGTPSAGLTKKLSSIKLPDTLKYTPVTFTYHGALPDGIKYKADKLECLGVAEGDTVFFYCYDPEKDIFEYIDEATYKSGAAIFKLPHCSEFIVTNEKLPTALTSITVKTGDATNAIPFVIALICGCAAIGVVVVRRRTVK